MTPTLLTGATDATAWRQRGVPVYGIGPFPIDRDDAARMHGDEERVALNSLQQGSEFVYRILRNIAVR